MTRPSSRTRRLARVALPLLAAVATLVPSVAAARTGGASPAAGAVILHSSMAGYAVVRDPAYEGSLGEGDSWATGLGSSVAVDHVATGQWTVTFAGIGAIAGNQGTAQVSPLATVPRHCMIGGWAPSGVDVAVTVFCSLTDGTPADVPFILAYLRDDQAPPLIAAGFVYAWDDLPGSGIPDPDYRWSTSGMEVSVTRAKKGRYVYHLLDNHPAVVSLSSYFSSNVCRAVSWARDTNLPDYSNVVVHCRNAAGRFADTASILFTAQRVSLGGWGSGGAYVVANKPSVARYRPKARERWSPLIDTRPVIRRSGPGVYRVTIPNQQFQGAPIVTPVGAGDTTCQVSTLSWKASRTRVGVRCFAPDGTPADSRFSVVISAPAPLV